MPVATECLDLFVRYQSMVAVYPGGAEGFHEHCINSIGLWHDGHIIRTGAMDPMSLSLMKDGLKEMGLREHKDFGTREPWIIMAPEGHPENTACLKGQENTAPRIDAENFEQFLHSAEL